MNSKAQSLKGALDVSLDEARQAVDLNPFREEGWRQIVDIYTKNSRYQTLENVLEYAYACSGFGYAVLSLEVLQNFIRNNSKNVYPHEAERALVHWVNLLIDNSLFTSNRLNFIPSIEEWPSGPNIQLHQLFYLDTIQHIDQRALQELTFWNSGEFIGQDPYRFQIYETLAKILKHYGDNNRLRNQVERAENFYNLAIKVIDSHAGSDETPSVYFETATALAEIYNSYPQLDGDNSKFRKLTGEMFMGKNTAYGSHDNHAIKKFHIALGIIYAQKGIWTSNGADNAFFQLEHALAYKNENEVLPYIRTLLAKGYLNHLGEREKAARIFMEAVEDYLLIDDFQHAETILEQVKILKPGLSNNDKVRLQSLEELTSIRKNLMNEFAGLSVRATIRKMEELEQRIDGMDLSTDLISYQKFKIFSEVGNQSTGNNSTYMRFMSYNKALESIHDLGHLNVYNDLTNLQRIKNFFSEEFDFNNPNIIQINKANPRDSRSGQSIHKRSYSLYLDKDNRYEVEIDNSLFEASQLVGYFSERDRQRIPEITFKDNHVIIRQDRVSERRKEAVEKDVKDIVKERDVIIK
jgi:hypothetical protein